MPHLYIPTVFWGNTAAQILRRNDIVFRDEIPFPVDLANHSFYTPSYLSTVPIPALDSLEQIAVQIKIDKKSFIHSWWIKSLFALHCIQFVAQQSSICSPVFVNILCPKPAVTFHLCQSSKSFLHHPNKTFQYS